ncbi:MAG: hypothetical protein KGL12_13750 [Rhodospirillales bacterium]|nr:hypothetical protein [Rhodospirillales bacterium]
MFPSFARLRIPFPRSRRFLPWLAGIVLVLALAPARADQSLPVGGAAGARADQAPLVGPDGLGQSKAPGTGTKELIALPMETLLPGHTLPDGAYRDEAARLARLMQGLHFGMTPEAVNALLPEPFDSAAWNVLPVTHYFGPTAVRYFWVSLTASGRLRSQIHACFGLPSYIAFYFEDHKLFLVSYRFATDGLCPRVSDAADEIFGQATVLGRNLVSAEHYRTLNVDVVDLWQPGILPVVHRRWQAETP